MELRERGRDVRTLRFHRPRRSTGSARSTGRSRRRNPRARRNVRRRTRRARRVGRRLANRRAAIDAKILQQEIGKKEPRRVRLFEVLERRHRHAIGDVHDIARCRRVEIERRHAEVATLREHAEDFAVGRSATARRDLDDRNTEVPLEGHHACVSARVDDREIAEVRELRRVRPEHSEDDLGRVRRDGSGRRVGLALLHVRRIVLFLRCGGCTGRRGRSRRIRVVARFRRRLRWCGRRRGSGVVDDGVVNADAGVIVVVEENRVEVERTFAVHASPPDRERKRHRRRAHLDRDEHRVASIARTRHARRRGATALRAEPRAAAPRFLDGARLRIGDVQPHAARIGEDLDPHRLRAVRSVRRALDDLKAAAEVRVTRVLPRGWMRNGRLVRPVRRLVGVRLVGHWLREGRHRDEGEEGRDEDEKDRPQRSGSEPRSMRNAERLRARAPCAMLGLGGRSSDGLGSDWANRSTLHERGSS